MGRRPSAKSTEPKSVSIANAKNSIKRNAPERDRILTVRDGQKKYVLPIKARMIAGDGFLYISIPAMTEIFRTDGRNAVLIGADEDGGAAAAALSAPAKTTARKGRRSAAPAVPDELLSMIPAGHRLVHGPDGPRFAKVRGARQKKKA